MNCPGCGAKMNEHAKKVVAPRNEAEASLVNEALEGIVVERYTCPACGRSASRIQTPA
jgi:hypothetical protein